MKKKPNPGAYGASGLGRISSWKTRIFNGARLIFQFPPFEKTLRLLTRGRRPGHPFCKLAPNCYQYPRGTLRTIQHNGLIFKVDLGDYVGNGIYFGFLDFEIRALLKLCQRDSVVLDIGANIGWTALNLARIAQNGKIFAFEPDEASMASLRANIALNHAANIQPCPYGLGDQNRDLYLETRETSNAGMNRICPRKSKGGRPTQVVRLDDFQPTATLNRLDLVKIDVEGFELKVLRGGQRLIRMTMPSLFIEIDDANLQDHGDSAAALIHFLGELGYRKILRADSGQEVRPDHEFSGQHFDILATKT